MTGSTIASARRLIFFAAAFLGCASVAWAQDFTVSNVIKVGANPQRAVITPNGREVYVTNAGDDSVSAIDAALGVVTTTLRLGKGKHPDALVVSADGKYVYVAQHEGDVSAIDTATKKVETISTGAGGDNHVRDLAVTPDGRKLYLAMEWSMLQVVDLASRTIQRVDDTTCPEGLALDAVRMRLYVSYQCGGPPGGTYGHDAIGIFDLESNRPCSFGKPRSEACSIKDLPNVGGQLSLSPDGARLWVNGIDACSRSRSAKDPGGYDNLGCPMIPGRAINVIDTRTNSLVKTIAFSNVDGNGPIAISPRGNIALIGGGTSLKILDQAHVELRQKVIIPLGGFAAFAPDGSRAFVPVGDKNSVAVLSPWNPNVAASDQGLSSLSLFVINKLLSDGVDLQEVISLIQEREVAFTLAPESEKNLRNADHTGAILRAIYDRVLLLLTRAQLP